MQADQLLSTPELNHLNGPSEMKTLGQIAYETYCDNRHWKSFDDKPLPSWDRVDTSIREAWEEAAEQVKRVIDERRDEDE
jgi:hypothetical protein